MPKYKIFHSKRFDIVLAKFDSKFQKQVDRIEDKLLENPYVGKLLNVKWFREKKTDKHRVYYLIYNDLKCVFMVAISDKKDQQRTINTIRLLLDFFRDELENLIDKNILT